MKHTDVLVIGAGPAGTVAASIIKGAGYEVEIVEKTQFPRFVIGESLLPRCLEALEEAGFIPALKEKKFQEKWGAKFVLNDAICDFTFNEQHTKGYNYAWQMPRADFDSTLADECVRKGIPVHYLSEVVDIKIDEQGHSITTVQKEDGSTFTVSAKFIVDGSGYGRVIPRLFNLDKPAQLPTRKTIFCHMEDPLRQTVEEPDRIVIYAQGNDCWIWTIPFSNGTTSVGFVALPEYFEQYGSDEDITAKFKKMIAAEPNLRERFKDVVLKFEPRILQGWSATSTTFYGHGFVLTGNVTEFLDPIFSSGVTLATVSAQKAANLVIKHLKGENVDWENDYMRYMEKGVDVFRTYVKSWYTGDLYKIFFADNKDASVKAQICSVLAGYVWDDTNPFVKNHERSVSSLINFLERKN
ncbi:pyridine nucleotide-disulfide oxidoreductase [Taibaiella sp. KBW10]|uniref:NAD(P)/FAD-dependent oxidoreductase n=1 Tax=Taibaiella sp. KBW10 TaxID=2153357 RepID=UPI000F5A56CE|nr:NAD(P)/FAD-dependent oxidoreductase [Taibaiella sp. KBW10]RQO31281.1 pyridine nucleotide-disulfide oxidoreductase [Taibaiella sp. KBW10]